MRQDSQRRRNVWALAISLALHAALLLVVVLQEPEAVAPAAEHEPIELTIIEVPPPPAPKPVPEPEPHKREERAETSKPVRAPVAAPPPLAAPSSGQTNDSAARQGSARDAPKGYTLVPRSDFPVASAGDAEGPRGHTVVNSEAERPDPVAMNEYTQEKLGRRTGAMVEGMVADTQARTGLVDPYFKGARSAMENDLSKGAVPGRKDLVRAGMKGYLAAQERYGQTGNPLAEGDRYAEQTSSLSLARTETNGPNFRASDTHAAGEVAKASQSMAAMHATMAAIDQALLTAVLEIVQEPGGGIADAHIVKSSGDRKFDEHVLHRARRVFLTLKDPPDEGIGISQAGWRTLWRFSYFPPSAAELRGQRVRVELIRVTKGMGSGNPLEHVEP